MNKKIDYEAGSGNVFADIGLPNAQEHLVKAQLVFKIDGLMKARGLKQVAAAKLFGVKQPDVSKMLRGDFRQFSVERLLRFLVALGQDVEIVVKPHRVARTGPRVRVTAATGIDEVLHELHLQLMRLEPGGDEGLEGVVAHALSTVLSRHFRVARAGRQHGRDGATNPREFDVFFEAKLYSGKPPSTESLQSKLLSAINAHQPSLDLWVIAATTALGENSVVELMETGERFGVSVIAIDWSGHPLPPLAILLAMACDSIVEWLRPNTPESDLAHVHAALVAITSHPSFDSAASELAEALTAHSSGFGAAHAKNAAWLKSKFANRLRARQAFGQSIAPRDPAFPSLTRQSEIKKILAAIADRNNDIVAITGDEGTGKTWLTTLAFGSLDKPPIFLLCTTEMAGLDAEQGDPIAFLAQLLLAQTGDVSNQEALERWIRRLSNWEKREDVAARIWLILDGLNERESRPWIAIIDKLMSLKPGLGVRLVLTSRRAFFNERILPRLRGYKVGQVHVEPLTKAEVGEGLRLNGANPDVLPDQVLEFLRNPRIFSIAVSMLDRLSVDELTRDRLLFEYWRKRAEERTSLRHTDSEIRELLISHARQVRARIQQARTPAAISFRRDLWREHSGLARRISDPTIDDELSEVESGAFFEPELDNEGNYRLRPQGVGYALGLLVTDELRSVSDEELVSQLDAALDPIRGLDLLSDALLAALGIACLDARCSTRMSAVILHSLLGIQNLADSRAQDVLPYVTARPLAFIEAAELQYGEQGRRHGRGDWITWLLFQRRDHSEARPHVDAAIRRWLGLWCREPQQFSRVGMSADQIRQLDEHNSKQRNGIAARFTSLTTAEKDYLNQHCQEVVEPQLLSIDELAVALLAGRALAPFADAIVAWQLSNCLNSRRAGPDLAWLIRLNPIDAKPTADALRQTLTHIFKVEPSETGLLTQIETLYSTGRVEDAEDADRLAAPLREGLPSGSWRRIEMFCDTDPTDPQSPHPTNLGLAVQRVTSIDPSSVRTSMSLTIEDRDLRDLTPALARFAPMVIVDKLRALAANVQERSGLAARFLGFELCEFSVLLTTSEIAALRAGYAKFAQSAETATDDQQKFAAQLMLLALFPHLDAKEQLEALQSLPDLKGEALQLKKHIKSLPPDILGERLQQAEHSNSSTVLRRTLFFASAGADMPFNDISRAVIGRSFGHRDPVIRLLAFDAAADHRDEELLTRLAKSTWSALDTSNIDTEGFCGSRALVRAPDEFHTIQTFMRMTPAWQASVADRWGQDVVQRHADVILEQIRSSLGLPSGLVPDVSVTRNVATIDQPDQYAFFDAISGKRDKNSIAALQELMSGSDKAWQAEMVRKQEAINSYLRKLNEGGARGLVDAFYICGLSAIARQSPDRFAKIIALLRSADGDHLSILCNVTACAAIVLSRDDPEAGATLLARISSVRPDVNLTVGGAELPFHHLALWLAQDSTTIRRLRRERLETATNDGALFTEVLCAAYSNKQAEVLELAATWVTNDHPGRIARGLTLLGFCDVNDVSLRLLRDRRFQKGFLAHVGSSARAIYERNEWARHWYTQAQAASDRVDWWRYIQLMLNALDGRFALWFDRNGFAIKDFAEFADFTYDKIKKRAKDKLSKRAKNLLGVAPPSEEVLHTLLQRGPSIEAIALD
jgi:predicted XRE-type DNA-binding protein